MTIQELLQKRGEAVAAMRSILDKAETEGRDLNAEETQSYEGFDKEQAEIQNRVKRLEAQNALDAGLDEIRNQPRGLQPQNQEDTETRPFASNAYRDAFNTYSRVGMNGLSSSILNALQVGTDSEGGFITPEEYDTAIVEAMQDINEIRALANVVSTASDRNIPIESTLGVATWTAEEAAYTESDPAFGRVVLGAHKLGRIIKVSEELLNDAFFDVGAYLVRNFGSSFGIAEEAAFVNGDGSGKPTGIVQGTTGNNTDAAGAAAITSDELIDVFHALARPYRSQATWLANDATIKLIRKLKDGDNQYLWQPGLQAGQPDMVLGRPFVASTAMPAATTGNVSVVFGDMSYYTIADRQGPVMQRLNELYAANGQVGWRMFRRVDGKVTLAAAFAKLTQA